MILVTGGAGFIGSHLVDALLARGEDVLCIDDFNDFYDPGIKRAHIQSHLASPRYRLIEADIRDDTALSRAFSQFPIEKIVHLAARAGVRPSLDHPLLYDDVNVRGTIALLELARLYHVQSFVFGSSSSVYGANAQVPFREDARIYRTTSPYAATKYSGELMCYTYHHLYGLPITCLRFFTVYGPRQRPEMAIHKFTRLISEDQRIPFYGDGSTARDYTYIDDIIQGVVAALDRSFPFEVFNFGQASPITLRDLVHQIEDALGKKAQLDHLPPQPGDVEITCADVSKAAQMLGYRTTTPIERGLKKFVSWFKAAHRSEI